MASAPETAPSRGNTPDAPSNSSPPPHSPTDSSPPPATESPPPAPPTSPPPAPPQSPPSSPPPSPPASSPPLSDSSPPPSSPTPTPPPPTQSPGTPPPNNPPTSTPPPPSTTNSPPAAPVTAQPPPPPGSPHAPIVSPPPPGAVVSHSPPSVALSPPHLPPGSSSTNGSSPRTQVSPPSSNSGGGSGISTGIIVAISFGGIAIIALLIVCLVFSRKKKKPQYYMDPGRPPKGGDQYYNNGHAQWNSPQPMEHKVNMPPPPGVMGGTPVVGGGGGGWGVPPPPPLANTSSDISPGGYIVQPASPMAGMGSQSQFTYEELATATNGFSQANLLGQGGFGYVHKGVLLDKREVAVKVLKTGSGQGEREFQAEVEIISRVHHRHLVSLVGYCIADGQRMLVYEFVPNKTLEFHLHGKGESVMDWASRLRIALGSAKGLAYLHEDCHPRIIHRDIKAANILLDSNFEAMVADFGLAKLTSDNFTHVSTRVMGTFGYLAPEYAASGKLTEKSDVFSFGVMLLELITGRRPVDPTNKTMEDSLVDWARPLMTKALEDGNYEELVDPRLEDNYVPHELARMVASAAASIRHSARRRPKMSQIVRALEGASSLEDLNETVKPTKSATQSSSTSTSTDIYDTRAYDADMMKFRKMVMTSPEVNSSEYGATSEYGLNPSSSSSDSAEIGKDSLAK